MRQESCNHCKIGMGLQKCPMGNPDYWKIVRMFLGDRVMFWPTLRSDIENVNSWIHGRLTEILFCR